jgi:hypothetical protein
MSGFRIAADAIADADSPNNHGNPFNPFASDARAHDSQDFARDAFDCFSLSIDTLL